MPESKDYEEYVKSVANESLDIFSKIADAAQSEIDDTPTRSRFGAFANTNTFMLEKAIEARRQIAEANLRGHYKLTQKPAIARVVAKGEDGDETIYYISWATPPRIKHAENIKLASSFGPKGELASSPVGKEVLLKDRMEVFYILEKAEFHPVSDAGEWDSRPAILESETCSLITVESLRAFLQDKDKVDKSVSSQIDELPKKKIKSKNVIKGRLRSTLKKMELPDQFILDQRQDELFRLPLDSRILLLGAPGTGKTTTLIRRLNQKSRREFLDADERKIAGIENEDLVAESNHSESWIMFTPTEFLKVYIREAFSRDGIPVPDEHISTWDEFRNDLAHRHFGILPSASRSGSYVMKDSILTLEAGAKTDLIAWFADFDSWQKTIFLEEMRGYAKNLREHTSSEISLLGKRLLTILGTDSRELQSSMFMSLLETTELIQKLIKDIKESSNKKIRGALNLQVNKDGDFLDNFASFIESLPEEKNNSDKQDADINAETEDEPVQSRVGRAGAQTHFIQVVRSQARAKARNGNVSKSSRIGRLIEWLGDRTLPAQELKELGKDLAKQSALRKFINPVGNYINKIPTRYRRFRKKRQTEDIWYCAEGFSSTDIHPIEVDIILLAMIRETNELIDVPRLNTPDNPAYKTLEKMQDLYRTQVLVDEVSDFSPIQLSCMMGIAHPGVRSFFACGDFHQRVTNWGTHSIKQMKWAIPNIDIREVHVPYRQSRQIHNFAEQIICISGGDIADVVLPKYENNEGVSPVLATQMSEVSEIANWLSQRIQEIERFVGEFPSIAVFVNSEEEVQSMADALEDAPEGRGIKAIPCLNGRIHGPDNAVRVFNVEYIKGLEFEAVFFVGIDILAKNQPDLFDKYLYVGATRAATYLGITCEQDLPSMMEELRELFGQDWR